MPKLTSGGLAALRFTAVVAAGLALGLSEGSQAQQAADEGLLFFQLATADGATRPGPFLQLDDDGRLTLKSERFSIREWLTLRRDALPLPAHPVGKLVVFANGDCVPLAEGKRVHIADNRLRFQTSKALQVEAEELAAPLPSIAALWLGGPEAADEPGWNLRKLVASRPTKDVVLLRNGDRLEGSLQTLDSAGEGATGCRIQIGQRRTDVRWQQIAAVVFNSDLWFCKVPSHPHYHVVLADGTRVALDKARLDLGSKKLRGTTLFGAGITAALADVAALEVRGGAAVYLSDLPARKFEHTPFLGTSWPMVLDGSVSGRELRLGDSTFDKGLGLHSESRVSYALDGKYRWFEALVGLDPKEGQGGRVRLRILVDGQQRDFGWNKELTFADGPLAVRIDVHKAREITLEVLFGTRGDVQAHVNWADARLLE